MFKKAPSSKTYAEGAGVGSIHPAHDSDGSGNAQVLSDLLYTQHGKFLIPAGMGCGVAWLLSYSPPSPLLHHSRICRNRSRATFPWLLSLSVCGPCVSHFAYLVVSRMRGVRYSVLALLCASSLPPPERDQHTYAQDVHLRFILRVVPMAQFRRARFPRPRVWPVFPSFPALQSTIEQRAYAHAHIPA